MCVLEGLEPVEKGLKVGGLLFTQNIFRKYLPDWTPNVGCLRRILLDMTLFALSLLITAPFLVLSSRCSTPPCGRVENHSPWPLDWAEFDGLKVCNGKSIYS